jgi:hypothetical protein
LNSLVLSMRIASFRRLCWNLGSIPRDETIIATALGTVNVNPELFLKAAGQARTRLDALFYRSSALLAAAYRQGRAPLHGYRMVEGVLCLLDETSELVRQEFL